MVCAIRAALLRWLIHNDERYLRDLERCGAVSERELRRFRDRIAERRVQLALIP